MRAIYLIILMLMLTGTVAAEKGIVLNETNMVLYKYDTATPPTLRPGEYIILSDEIDSVLKDAKYDTMSKTFTNPIPAVPEETVIITAEPSKLDPNVILLSGAGIASAYIIARRKKT